MYREDEYDDFEEQPKKKRPKMLVQQHGAGFQVIDATSGLIWRTLDSRAEANAWIADALDDGKRKKKN